RAGGIAGPTGERRRAAGLRPSRAHPLRGSCRGRGRRRGDDRRRPVPRAHQPLRGRGGEHRAHRLAAERRRGSCSGDGRAGASRLVARRGGGDRGGRRGGLQREAPGRSRPPVPLPAATALAVAPARRGLRGTLSTFLYRQRVLQLLLLLVPPLLWFGVVYVGS